MAGKVEKSKGKVKEAVGTLTGNKKLESEGKIDRRAGEKAERKATEAIDKAKDATRRK
jgi:uncharacterized protein YjbJ (UPF0337 family)